MVDSAVARMMLMTAMIVAYEIARESLRYSSSAV